MLRTDLLRAPETGAKNLLIALHGLGDSMEGYRWLPRALGLPGLNVLLANAPDSYYGGFSWYDFAGNPGPGVERSFGLLDQLLQDCARQGFPPERTILFGFSQGCLMSIETALRHPARLAGIIGVSGYVHEPERLLKLASPAAKEQKLLLTHGRQDPLIPIEKVRLQWGQLRAAGIQLESREFDKDHTIIEEELDLFRGFTRARLQTRSQGIMS